MKSFIPIIAAAAALFEGAAAHYRLVSLIANGTTTAPFYYVRSNTNSNSPVTDVTSKDIRCNVGGLASGGSTQVGTVTAGSEIGFQLDQAIFHPGPFNVYLSKSTVSDVRQYDGSGPWFKIATQGATFSGGQMKWPADNAVNFKYRIPARTPPGQYLMRIEHIALHSASSAGGAQFYISCAQINVVGSGGGNPGPTILLPGGYNANDPSIKLNIYYPVPTSYTPPGPAVWTG